MTAPAARAAQLFGLARRPPPARAHRALLVAVLLLSAYVHLWNPAGFPDVFFDEGVYMRRAMHLAETGSPQESHLYDHPYLGQILLAGFLKAAGFPESAAGSPEAPYLAPRILMGLLAVLDTFLVYRIADARLGRRAAVIAAVLFAAMPMTWMLRRIVLDGLALPLVLSSILLAANSGGRSARSGGALVACSAALLGLAVFTKATAVAMAPVVAYLVVSARGWRALPAWLALAAAAPAAWPAMAAQAGQARLWLDGVLWQAGRQAGAAGERLAALTAANLAADPVLMGLGLAGAAYAAARRRLFLALWLAPFALLSAVTYFQYFHYILVLPALCASAAFMIDDVISRRLARPAARRAAAASAAVLLAAAGGAWSGALVSEDLTSAQFEAVSHVASTGAYANATVLAPPTYSWVLSDVHGMPDVAPDYSHVLFYPVEAARYVLVADSHLLVDLERGERLADAYARSAPVWEARLRPACGDGGGGGGGPAWDPCAAAMHLAASEGSFVQVRTGHAGPLAEPPAP